MKSDYVEILNILNSHGEIDNVFVCYHNFSVIIGLNRELKIYPPIIFVGMMRVYKNNFETLNNKS